MNILFFLNSFFLGLGLTMDAFSVSMANGMNEPGMSRSKTGAIAGTYAFFQFIMPVIGWYLVRTIVGLFDSLRKYVPWIAFLILLILGIKMIYDALNKHPEKATGIRLTAVVLVIQGIATSIDALSVGFTISDLKVIPALVCAMIIAAVTFAACFAGVEIGKRFGIALGNKAQILGGIILMIIGAEILIKGLSEL